MKPKGNAEIFETPEMAELENIIMLAIKKENLLNGHARIKVRLESFQSGSGAHQV